MGFLRGLMLSLLSLLLFLSLSIFGLVFMLNQTVLSPNFINFQARKLDFTSLAKEFIIPQLPPEILNQEFIIEALDKTLTELEPLIEREANDFIRRGYDYLLGERHTIRYTISLEEPKTTLRDNIWEAFLKNPPPELESIPPNLVEPLFDQYYNQFAGEIPPSLEFDMNSLDPEVISQLKQAREIIGYIKVAFWGLIGLMMVLILSIFLISRSIKTASLGLGLTFLIYGIFEIASVIVAREVLIPQLPIELPSVMLEAWLFEFASEMMTPLLIFGIGVAAAGLVLIIASFFFKPTEEAY